MAEWVGIGVALALGLWNAYQQHAIRKLERARRQEELAARDRSDLYIRWEPRMTSRGRPGRSLVMVSQGHAPAKTARFDMRPVGQGDLPALIRSEGDLPIPTLEPGQSYSWNAEFFLGGAPAVDIDLHWSDDTGPRHKTVRLSTLA